MDCDYSYNQKFMKKKVMDVLICLQCAWNRYAIRITLAQNILSLNNSICGMGSLKI